MSKEKCIYRSVDKEIKMFYDWMSVKDLESIANHFNCKPSEICCGDYIARISGDEKCPYKVILGYADFSYSNTEEGNLEYIVGRKNKELTELGTITYSSLNTRNSKYTEFKTLKKVYGSVNLNPATESTGSIEYIGGSLYLNHTNIVEFPNLKYCGILSVDNSKLQDLGAVERIYKLICTSNSRLLSLGNVKRIDRGCLFVGSRANKYQKELTQIKQQKLYINNRKNYIDYLKSIRTETPNEYKRIQEEINYESDLLDKLETRYRTSFARFEQLYKSPVLIRKLFQRNFERVSGKGYVAID